VTTRYYKPEEIPFDFQTAYRQLKIRKESQKFKMMHDMVESIYSRYLQSFEPRFRYKISKVLRGHSGSFSILLEGSMSFSGRGIHRLLTQSRYAAVFMLTVGDKIDAEMVKLSQDDFAEAFFLDGIATTMTHGMLQLLEAELLKDANSLGCKLGSRFAPGYARWELAEQKKLFQFLKAEEIGISLSDTYFMLPQKSISGVYSLS
jgi:hypothetical protein